jgi:hypothetical protein
MYKYKTFLIFDRIRFCKNIFHLFIFLFLIVRCNSYKNNHRFGFKLARLFECSFYKKILQSIVIAESMTSNSQNVENNSKINVILT